MFIRDIYFFHTVVSTDCDENVYIVYFEEIYFYGLTRVCILYKYIFFFVCMCWCWIWRFGYWYGEDFFFLKDKNTNFEGYVAVLRVIEKEIITFFGAIKNYFLTNGHQIFFFDGFCINTFRGYWPSKKVGFFVMFRAVVCKDGVFCQISSKDEQLGKRHWSRRHNKASNTWCPSVSFVALVFWFDSRKYVCFIFFFFNLYEIRFMRFG